MSDLISRQNAIKGVKELFACADIGNDEYDITYMLENLPSADRPTVDKEYLIDLIQEAVYDGEACAKLIDLVDRPTGKWVLKEHLWECDQCGCRINRANPLKGNIWNYNFCPNCGSYNGGEEE